MSAKTKYNVSDVINNGIIFIEDVPTDKRMRKAKFKCHCGKEFITTIASVKFGNAKSCGCRNIEK